MVDDAAITFAYARSISDGLGPVVAPGAEPVEGFSNPTWTALLSGLVLGLFDRSTLFNVQDYVLFPKLNADRDTDRTRLRQRDGRRPAVARPRRPVRRTHHRLVAAGRHEEPRLPVQHLDGGVVGNVMTSGTIVLKGGLSHENAMAAGPSRPAVVRPTGEAGGEIPKSGCGRSTRRISAPSPRTPTRPSSGSSTGSRSAGPTRCRRPRPCRGRSPIVTLREKIRSICLA